MIKTETLHHNLKQTLFFVICFGVIGCVMFWRSFAATPADADINKDGVINVKNKTTFTLAVADNKKAKI
jgi:hypothetical protein